MLIKQNYLCLCGHCTSFLTSLKNSSRSLHTDCLYQKQTDSQIWVNFFAFALLITQTHLLTEAEAKTPSARLSLQRSSCCSRTLALACSCASLAVGMVISCSALSSSPPLTSLILVSSSSSFSSSFYIYINVT